jgi:hypothetical protein
LGPGLNPADIAKEEVNAMIALLALILIVLIFGGLGFLVHVLWWVLIAALILWILGFVFRGGSRRWYYW